MIQNKSGEGEDFAKADSIYYKIKLDIDDILYVGGIYGFSDKGNLTKFQKKSKYSTWSKTWKTRYSFTLCDKNRKVIDPISKHAPGKKTYPYMYSLKKGTYYLKIYTKKKKCKYYLIDAYYSTDNYGPHFSENETGKTKKKAVRIKNSSDKGTVYGISFSFPLNSGSKKTSGWIKYYTDGKDPLNIHVGIAQLTGAWDLVVYGPSYPKGHTVLIPDKVYYSSFYQDIGRGESKSVALYQNGRKVSNNCTFEIYRKSGSKVTGVKKGWYYIQIRRRPIKGFKTADYKKTSITGILWISDQ